jgi:hypothetical protein
MWLKLPRVEGQGAKKEVCFVHRIFFFHFFSFKIYFLSWFCIMLALM